jgi:TrmH family RNA methyltransferase
MITSVHNSRIAQVRRLLEKRREREESCLFVIEGVRLVEEAWRSGWEMEFALFSQAISDRGLALKGEMIARGMELEEVEEALLNRVSDTETCQGLLAVVHFKELALPDRFDFILTLDGIRDPGNLGTLLRSAISAGVQVVLLAPGCADAFSPKVLRSGMGAHFRIPLLEQTWDQIEALAHSPVYGHLSMLLAEAEDGQPYYQADLRQPVMLVIGGEAEGASEEAHKRVDGKINIPMPGKSESLNAAVAAGILLFDVVRQRSI